MFSTRNIERLAGTLLVAGFVAFLVHVVTLDIPGTGPTTIFFVLIYGFLVILSALTLYLVFRTHERTLALVGAFGLAAHGLLLVAVCAMILARFKLTQEFPASGGAEADFVSTAARALHLTMDKVRTSAFIFLGMGLAPLGILIVWSGVVARWLGWLGAVGGIGGSIVMSASLFDIVAGGPDAVLMQTVLLTTFAFMLILGVRLILWETKEIRSG